MITPRKKPVMKPLNSELEQIEEMKSSSTTDVATLERTRNRALRQAPVHTERSQTIGMPLDLRRRNLLEDIPV